MNDFTKEELKELRSCIFYAFNNAYNTPEETLQKIYNQIGEMIDKICEHNWQYGYLNIPDNEPIKVVYCPKCGEFQI